MLTSETLPGEQNIDTHSKEFRANQSPKKPKTTKHLTLITGSCILKNVETRFLDQNIRVKHFKDAKIDTLKDASTKMDLSVYKNIVLDVGGYDVDQKMNVNTYGAK